MAIEPPSHYWTYTIQLTDDDLMEFESLARNGRGEYVAGKLIGLLRANGKIHIVQNKPTPPRKDKRV